MFKAPFPGGKNTPELLAHCPSHLPRASGLAPRILSSDRFNRVGTEYRPRVAALEGVVPSSSSNAIAFGTHLYSKIVEILPAPNCPECACAAHFLNPILKPHTDSPD